MSRRANAESWVAVMQGKHAHKYDYSLVEYISNRVKVKIICPEHGVFQQTPNNHTLGKGCPVCGLISIGKTRKQKNKNIEATTSTKICVKCNIDKPINAFAISKRMLHGVNSSCKECRKKEYRIKQALKKPLPMFQTHRKCPVCKECLSVSDFGSLKAKKLGPCRACKSAYSASVKDQMAARSKRKWTSPAQSRLYINKMLPEDEPEDRNGLLYVACKHCRSKFNPLTIQASNRVRSSKTLINGDSNLYCSDKCRDSCDIYGMQKRRKSDVRSNTRDKARSCQTPAKRSIIEGQCSEFGYSFCERCGDAIDTDLHHTRPVASNGSDIDNPAGYILLCPGCHTTLHSECR